MLNFIAYDSVVERLVAGNLCYGNLLNSPGIVDNNRTNALLCVFDEWVPGKVEAVATELEEAQLVIITTNPVL